jgi:hypothetical protein
MFQHVTTLFSFIFAIALTHVLAMQRTAKAFGVADLV